MIQFGWILNCPHVSLRSSCKTLSNDLRFKESMPECSMFSFERGKLLVWWSAGTSTAISVRRLGIRDVISGIYTEGGFSAFWRGLTGRSRSNGKLRDLRLVFSRLIGTILGIVNCISLSCIMIHKMNALYRKIELLSGIGICKRIKQKTA